MTVQVVSPYKEYAYTATGDFSFSFKIFDESELILTVTEASGVGHVLVLNTDYTVAIDPSGTGGICTLTYTTYYGTLGILRDVAQTQETDWVNNDPFDMDILEDAVDKLTILVQDLEYTIENNYYSWRGTWTASAIYKQWDVVFYNYVYYVATADHTAPASWTGANWDVFFDATALRTSELNAATSESNAATSESNAATSESNAATSESNAATSETNADNWANYPHNSQVPGYPGEYSAYHWKEEARLIAGDYVPIDGNPTGAAIIPDGTTAQRPGTPTAGYLRWNTDILQLEVFDNISLWRGIIISTYPTGAMYGPAGLTSERPGTPVAGMLRYNTTYDRPEVYNGATWYGIAVQSTDITGSLSVPAGTTAQRPGSPGEGVLRYNTDSDQIEVYSTVFSPTSQWRDIPSKEHTVTSPLGAEVYVATTGSDTANTGLTSGSPFKTLERALEFLQNLNFRLSSADNVLAVINVANGTYIESSGFDIGKIPGISELQIIGGGKATCILQIASATGFEITGCRVNMFSLTIKATSSSMTRAIFGYGSYISLNSVAFDDSAQNISTGVEIRHNSHLYTYGCDFVYGGAFGVRVQENSHAQLNSTDFQGKTTGTGYGVSLNYFSSAFIDNNCSFGNALIAVYANNASNILVEPTPSMGSGITTQYSPAKSVVNVMTLGNANSWIANDA